MLTSTFARPYTLIKRSLNWFCIILISGSFALAQTTVPSALSATFTATPTLLTATNGTSLSATVRGGIPPYSYTFNGPGAITANGSSSATVASLIPGVHTFTLTARDTGAPASGTIAAVASQTITATASVTVPGGSLVGTTTICAGQSATLNVGVTNGIGPYTLVYTSSGSSSTGVVNTTVTSYTSGNGIVVTPNATTTYTLISLAGANGLALPVGGVVVVTVNPIPDLTVLGSPVLCGSAPTTITATGGTSYLLGSTVTFPQSSTTGTFTLFQPGSYSLTATSAGCSRSLAFSVSVGTAIPNASLVASSTLLTCLTTSVSLVASPGGTNYSFTGPGVTQSGINNQIVVNQAGTYSAFISGLNGCTAVVSTTVFSNTSAPAGTIQQIGQISCSNNVVSLSATGAAPGSLYIFGGNGLLQASQTGSVTVNSEGTYSVIFTGSNGCRTTLTTTVVSNTAGPQAFLFANNVLSCTVPVVTLTGPSGNRDYYFSGPGLFRATSANSMTINAPGVYSVLLIGENGCTGIASTTVGFTPNTSVASLVASNQISCAATSATLVAAGTGSVFAFNGPGISQFGSATSVTINQPGKYLLTVTGLPGCSATAVTEVFSITTAPFVSITQSGTIGCTGGSVTLTNINTGNNFRFTGPGGFATANTSGTATVTQAGTYTLVTTSPLTGCSGVTLIPVVANCDSKTTDPPSSTTATPTTFRILAPAYNCQTGAITLQTAGGDGSAITFFTPGVTRSSPQSVTGIVEAGIRFDPKPLILYATQNGVTVSITFDLVILCIRGRVATSETAPALEVTVLGNPTTGESVSIEVRGAEGKPISYQIRDLTGRLLTERQTETAPSVDRQSLRLGSAGMYLLNISTPTQSKTVKVIRQ
ncbi:MAG: T9SS type A sorting domain-containing protein [Rudanella sp.]|nr:T9SS type A sorting domain-containing protein [Rudanella sp.]